jgi:serine/threonine-protein kinase
MGAVYAAAHRNGNRVAIKVLSRELTANPQMRQRFLREGYAANRVGHDGAVKVLDDDVAEGDIVFLVMELLDGETLAARAQRLGPKLPANEVVAATSGLLDVLAAAHASGIIHRDVKPANVFLTRGGRIKLLDFGIASLAELPGGTGGTRPGSRLGTPGFMAPEQARGRWEEVDARTDVWSVGATMFLLLTGRAVHGGETEDEAVIAAATREAPPIASVEPGLPPSLAAVVDRALCLGADQRWACAEQMRGALEEVRAGLTPVIWQVPAHEPDARSNPAITESEATGSLPVPLATPTAGRGQSPRHNRGARGLLLVAAGVIALAAGGLWLGRGLRGHSAPPPPARAERLEAIEPPLGPPPSARPVPTPAWSAPGPGTTPARAHPPGRPARRPTEHRRPGAAPLPAVPAAPKQDPPTPAAPDLRELLNQRR